MNKKKFLTVALAGSMTICCLAGCNGGDYKEASAKFEEGDYQTAGEMFSALGDYEDSANLASICKAYIDLDGKEWYFSGDDATVLNKISFQGKNVSIDQVYYDGNGINDNGSNSGSYELDASNISVTLSDGNVITMPYEMKHGKVSLENKYLSEDQIEEGIQGYWKVKTSVSVLGKYINSESNIFIDNGNMISERAVETDAGSYNYFGPYEGNYELEFGSFSTDMSHGSEWFFGINDGKVVILHFGDICEATDSLPGEDGYSF